MKILKNYRIDENEVSRFNRSLAKYNSMLPTSQRLLSRAQMVEQLMRNFSNKMNIPKKLEP